MNKPVDNVPARSPAGDHPDDQSLTSPAVSERRDTGFPVVGIGASAGGLDAFTQLLKHLPADSGMAFVLVQHLDPTHPSFLREALSKATAMSVIQPGDGLPVEPNHVYVIPPDFDMAIRQGRVVLSPRAREARGPHLPVDFCFRSLAEERGSHAIGVVLSGNASDGTEGLRAIKAEGGITFAQDPASAKFAEMPQSALAAGVVDASLSMPELAQELVRLSGHPYVTAAGAAVPPASDAALLDEIVMVVRNTVGVDFAEYKSPTFERRLARRMALRRLDTVDKYLALLHGDPDEVRLLYEEILIHVTAFFRDREVFAALESEILPALLKDKPAGVPLRVWVAGCSTGEEVYSLGILLLEALGDSARPIQIFGSDVSEAIIAKARAGVYPDAALRDVSEERRRRFFVKVDRGYRITKAVRDLCVFVQHDLARDPPFSKLDLVSCRNVLIYFDQPLQKRIIPTFHYSLNQPGFLLLGRTESISGFSQLFSPIDKANKLFVRTAVPSVLRFAPRAEARPAARHIASPHASEHGSRPVDLGKHLDRMLLSRYAPPGVLINEKMEILQFRGETGAFLQPAPGEPQNNLFKMARVGVLATLRGAIAEAKKAVAPVRRSGVEVEQGGVTSVCDLVVVPFTGLPEVQEPLYVVLFEEAASPPRGTRRRRTAPITDALQRKLEHELTATKEYLQSLIEEHGQTNDDLGSANEELVSATKSSRA